MNFKPDLKKEGIEKGKYELISQYMVPLRNLITFNPEQSIMDIIDTMIEKKISGAPVMDDKNKLVGIISEKDCLRIILDHAYHNLPLSTRKVSDYMTTKVKTLQANDDIVTAANEFLNSPIRRMPVVENNILVGQISRRDILKATKEIKSTTW